MTAFLTRSLATSTGFFTPAPDQFAAGANIGSIIDFEELAQSFYLPNSRLKELARTHQPPEDWYEDIGDLF